MSEASGQVCANIGPKAVRLRRRAGYVGAAAAALLLAALLWTDAPRAWRLVLFAPLWMATLGFLQAREKT